MTMLVNTIPPDLTIIEGGIINDWRQGVAIATSMANIQTIITAAASVGNVLLITPSFDNGSGGNTSSQEDYVTAFKALGVTNSIAVLDWRTSITSHAAATAAGLIDDSVHPTYAGYADIARMTLNLLG